jgi:hypothetical protein
LARGAGWRIADLTLRQLMQQQLARLAAGMRCENFAAQLAEIFKPRAEVFGQLLVDLAAQTLRDGGAFAGGGDGDLQIAAADHEPKRNRSWECRRRCCRGCRARRRRDKRLR